jgi:hypothetical protein
MREFREIVIRTCLRPLWAVRDLLFAKRAPFCTSIHKFAQTFPPISIDALNEQEYLPVRLNRKA